MKLLLVDDNDRIREMMRNMCSAHFDEVIECCDGTEALVAFNDTNPDWVVMDIKMKKMDGLEATSKIVSRNPEAKIIVVSQFDDETTEAAAKHAGAIEFISKENLSNVIEFINNHLRSAK
ncbi:MAG: response regulator [Ignavibacterium sp.]|nr:response regulator [Ignavibacterium sp.]